MPNSAAALQQQITAAAYYWIALSPATGRTVDGHADLLLSTDGASGDSLQASRTADHRISARTTNELPHQG